ncbi:phage shock protein PspA [Alginatibacterium sediminis]|uniref:Phage shock protein PspA n=1 Tax=Alginatibacterium sediminis TaxID=2164068 RepID=A0A420EGK5_9ALTE|nr:phage shock protein PspA [Alginatibacterium sediminis]RKF19819.1 phage shock protein PspA [Alginatibacterium sediminis]
MSIFTRLADVINANLSNLLDKAEDPQKMLRLIIQEMEDTLIEVRSSTAKVLADKKQLLRKIDSLKQRQDEWQSKAELAIGRGREDLAKAALIEKNRLGHDITVQQQELGLVDDALAQLQDEIEKLEAKLRESRNRQDAMLARQKTAHNRYAVRQQLDSTRLAKTREKFEQFQAKIDHLEAKAESFGQVSAPEANDLEREFEQLQAESEIADELEQLKTKLNQQSNAGG